MDSGVKKGLMIASIVILTVILIKHITNASTGSSSGSSTSKTVVVHDNPHRYYYGFNEPVHRNYNSYKAQYYN
jgi:maltose-binding protein MalE